MSARFVPRPASASLQRLLLAAVVSLILPACSTFQLGRPDTGIENGHVQAVVEKHGRSVPS